MKDGGLFVQQYERSKRSVRLVADHLAEIGFDVRIKVSTLRKDEKDRWDHTDSGDIELLSRVEVKHRRIDFTSVDDYPYPTVIIDEEYKVSSPAAKGKSPLRAYAIVNSKMTHICWIEASTRKHWLTESRYDKTEGSDRRFVLVPKDICKFYKIGE